MKLVPWVFVAATALVFLWGGIVATTEHNKRPAHAGAAPMPAWLRDLPHEGAMQYRYQGKTVYYVPPGCCDLPGMLYDDQGRLLCHPDGGFTGLGDRRCPDFADTRTDGRPLREP